LISRWVEGGDGGRERFGGKMFGEENGSALCFQRWFSNFFFFFKKKKWLLTWRGATSAVMDECWTNARRVELLEFATCIIMPHMQSYA
jgi:hypothetical protein